MCKKRVVPRREEGHASTVVVDRPKSVGGLVAEQTGHGLVTPLAKSVRIYTRMHGRCPAQDGALLAGAYRLPWRGRGSRVRMRLVGSSASDEWWWSWGIL